jgi:hypothetical protein
MDDRRESYVIGTNEVDDFSVAVNTLAPTLALVPPPKQRPAPILYFIAAPAHLSASMYPDIYPEFVFKRWGGALLNPGITSNYLRVRYSSLLQRQINAGEVRAHVLSHPTFTQVVFPTFAAELQQMRIFNTAMHEVLIEHAWEYFPIGKSEAQGYQYTGPDEPSKELYDKFIAAVFSIVTPAVKEKTKFVEIGA